jgi:hypothetical protein
MPLIIQNLLVLLLVAACVAWVGRQAFQSLRGRRSKLGSCCAKGCTTTAPEAKPTEQQSPAAPRIAFIPLEQLARRKNHRKC